MFFKRQPDVPDGLRCSFCHKSQDVVSKLISSPIEDPRAYICNECVAVCVSILEDASSQPVSGHPPAEPSDASHPLLGHPLATRFMASVEEWIQRESLGGDAAEELAEVRDIATHMMRTMPPDSVIST